MSRSPLRVFQLTCNYNEGMWCAADPTRRFCSELSCCVSDSEGWDVKMSVDAASPVCESVMWDDGGEASQAKCGARSPVNSPIISGEFERCACHCCSLWCFYIRKATALNTFFHLEMHFKCRNIATHRFDTFSQCSQHSHKEKEKCGCLAISPRQSLDLWH